MQQPIIMDATGLHRTVVRLSHEIEERCEGLSEVVLVGVKRDGEIVARRLAEYFARAQGVAVPCAGLDIEAKSPELGFSVDGKTVVLCDDILHTGRSALAAVEALFRLGRPAAIKLLVLVDRGGRELPVRADFVGKNVPTSRAEFVGVRLTELGAAEDAIFIPRTSNS